VGNPCDRVLPGSEYHDGFCFLPVARHLSLDQAQTRCAEDGGFLAEPRTESLRDFLTVFAGMMFDPDVQVILGATRTPPESRYRWLTSGQLLTDGPADNSSTDLLRAVYMDGPAGWEWTTATADTIGYFICQTSRG
ncbi:hypothetical protein PoB_001410200, partial [Plakobranchus ocellatus]